MLRTKKILSVLLAIMMLMQTLVISNFAADVDSFTDFPKNSWSTEAMTAAVDNGLLVGTSETTIEPAKNLTRAEFAAIVTRAFGATKTADISNFKDVSADDWFYESVAKVVQMGVMNGTGATTFDPNAFMKREDVILAMARILFVDGDDTSVLNQFSDREKIDTWSVKAIAGMVAEDYVHGYEDGTIRPQNFITREELAQLFHNIFRTYISEDGEFDSVASEGSVIVRSKYVTLKNVTINGDLIMADGIGDGDFRISDVHVTGKIIARGGEGMNYFVNVTSDGKVIVNDPNGVVNFYNYRDEDTPFKNDNVIENTPATFLERQKEDDKPTSTGGGVTKKYDFFIYESLEALENNEEPLTKIEKQKNSYVIKEEDVPTDEEMYVEGKEFQGWSQKGNIKLWQREDLVGEKISAVSGKYYPVYVDVADEYTITFVTPDGEVPVTKTEGETLDASEIPEITVDESKEFLGWTKTEGSTNVDFTNDELTADVVENLFDSTDVKLYPVIKDKDATTVIFKAPDGDVEITKYNNPDYVLADADVPADPTPEEGYTFEGWSKDPAATEGEDRDYFVGKKISEVEGTWYPVFVEIPDEYTITFVTPDGEVPVTKTEGETLDASEIPEITVDESKEFLGWTKTEGSDEVVYTDSSLTADVVENIFDSTEIILYPVIVDKDSYVVIFMNGNQVVKSVTKYDPDYVFTREDLPAEPIAENSRFTGWKQDVNDENDGYATSDFLNKKISEIAGTWYATSVDVYTITFKDSDENELDSFKKDEGTVIAESEIPEVTAPEGFTFEGWTTTNGSKTVEFTNEDLTADVVENVFEAKRTTLYPVFKEILITIIFKGHYPLGDGSTPTISTLRDLKWSYVIPYGNLPSSSSSSTMRFVGWSTDMNATEPQYTNEDLYSDMIGKVLGAESSMTITLYTIYEIIPAESELYTVEFKYIDGSEALPTVSKELAEDDYVLTETDVYDVEYFEEPEMYEFLGWTTTVDGTDYLTSEELRVSIKTLGTVYYAQFKHVDEALYKVEHYFEQLDGQYVIDDEKTEELYEYPGLEVTATPIAAEELPEGYEYDYDAEPVKGIVIAEDGEGYPLTLKLYYDLKVIAVRYFDLAMDAENPTWDLEGENEMLYNVKYGGTIDNFFYPDSEFSTEDNETIKAEIEEYIEYLTIVGYGKDYDDEYFYNEFDDIRDGDYAYNTTDTYGQYAHEHEINFKWYVEDEVEEFVPFDEAHVFTEDLDVFSKVKKLNVAIEFPSKLTDEALTLNVPYEESTRFLDSIRDALFLNDNVATFPELTGLEDQMYDKLGNVGGKFFDGDGVFNDEHEINNTDVMIYFYQMMGGKEGYKKWLWEEVEEAVRDALGRGTEYDKEFLELRNGRNQEQALKVYFVDNHYNLDFTVEPYAEAKRKYYDSAEFIEMSTEEEYFYATVDNEFIMERVYEKIDGLKTIDSVIDEYAGGRIPAGLLNRLPMEMIEDIYEPRVARFLEELEIAREAAKNGEPKEDYPLDSGIIFDINLVEELLIPLMEYAEDMHEEAVDKAVSSGNKAAELIEKYYVDNPYTTGDAGNYGVVNYAFNHDFYVEDEDGDGFYSIRSFEEIYNDVIMPESVESIDALLWYMDPEGGAVDFAKIRKLAEENEDLILALHNHPHKLMADYAENGLPEDMITYYEDLLSDPDIKAAVEKLDNKVSFDMMYFVESKIQNATLEMYYLKVLERVGIPVEGLLSKYTNSKAYKELTHEDFAKLLDQLEECWATVDVDGVMVENANGTTDYVFDNVLEKVGKSGNKASLAVKGFEMTLTRFFADDLYQEAPQN